MEITSITRSHQSRAERHRAREAHGTPGGVIAAGATVASQDVNFTLIPRGALPPDGERGFLADSSAASANARTPLSSWPRAPVRNLLDPSREQRDASGNVKLKDVGVFLRQQIEAHSKAQSIPVALQYFDPRYEIRSCAADSEDTIFCDLIARHAVHAAMAGKTGLVIGHMHGTFIHVPIEMLTREQKRIDPDGIWWQASSLPPANRHPLNDPTMNKPTIAHNQRTWSPQSKTLR